MKVEVAVLGFQSLIVLMVSVDVKHHISLLTIRLAGFRAQELCESLSGRPGLPVPNSPYGLCGREATLHLNTVERERQSSGAM